MALVKPKRFGYLSFSDRRAESRWDHMPKVWEEAGFRFYVYYNDHTPAHVHVEKAEGEVLIVLGDAQTKPSIREVRGMSFANVKRALTIALREQDNLMTHWRRIHGARTH